MKYLLALAAAIALCLGAAPAHAGSPVLGNAVYRTADAPVAADQVVRLELPPATNTWRIWKSAKAIDAQVDGLTISRGSCAAVPYALCVRVEVGAYDEPQMAALAGRDMRPWSGLTAFPGLNERIIYLNTARTFREDRTEVARHELGHTLGLAHHTEVGLMTVSPDPDKQTKNFSTAELDLLRGWYAVPRFADAQGDVDD